MRIVRLESRTEAIPLSRPYAIAGHATEAAELAFVRLVADDGSEGVGCAAPVEEITGESFAMACTALRRMQSFAGEPAVLLAMLARDFDATPAAAAAIDMALHDLQAKAHGRSLVTTLGRAVAALPTSVTIGIRALDATLAEADEYRGRGFTVIKVKIGEHLDGDIERLVRLPEHLGDAVRLRADANQGYAPRDVERFVAATARVGLEFVEQPCPRAADAEIAALPRAIRRQLCADESLMREDDADRLLRGEPLYGVWNIKLAKCGGVSPALRIARRAESNGIAVMWGCMDESVVSIAAALHAAYASRATRYLDLDGSFDLARDPFRGGFSLRAGVLDVLERPGLGVEAAT